MKLGFDLILLGDPTAGKDTQANLLLKKYDLRPVESGKYWRTLAKKNNFEGKLIRKTMGLGHPTPVALMKKFLLSNLNNLKKNKDLIFIGNPRLKPEAQFAVKLLKKEKRDFFVIYLKLPEKEIYRRSLIRIRMQTEDKEQYIRNRINWHKNQVSKTVKYFEKLHRLKFVNGNQPIAKVAKNIQKLIYGYQRSKRN
jgi:adenylate kinase